MARIDTLDNFLTDVASAIKIKTKTTEPIYCKDFDTKIMSIDTGGGGEIPSDEKWVRPSHWLPYPEVDDTLDSVYFLVEANYNEDVLPMHIKAYTLSASIALKIEILYETPITISDTFQIVDRDFGMLRGSNMFPTGKDGVSQVWIKCTTARGRMGTLEFSAKTAITTQLGITEPILPIVEIYGNGTTLPLFNTTGYKQTLKSVTFLNEDKFAGSMQGRSMFSACTALENFVFNGEVSGDMSYMFSDCTNLKYFNAPKLAPTHLTATFRNAPITKLPNLDYSKCADCSNAFLYCKQLIELDEIYLPLATNVNYMFGDCVNLEVVKGVRIGTSIPITSLFSGCPQITRIEYVTVDTPSGTGLSLHKSNILNYLRLPSYEGANFAGVSIGFNAMGVNMSGEGLNILFESLLPYNRSLSYNAIDISKCIGKQQCNKSLAVGKGYQIIS